MLTIITLFTILSAAPVLVILVGHLSHNGKYNTDNIDRQRLEIVIARFKGISFGRRLMVQCQNFKDEDRETYNYWNKSSLFKGVR